MTVGPGEEILGGGIIKGELQSDGEKWGSHLSPTNGGIGSPSPALGWGRAQKCPPPTSPPLFLWGRGAVGGHWEVNPNTSAVWNASSMEGRDVLLYWFVPNVGKKKKKKKKRFSIHLYNDTCAVLLEG